MLKAEDFAIGMRLVSKQLDKHNLKFESFKLIEKDNFYSILNDIESDDANKAKKNKYYMSKSYSLYKNSKIADRYFKVKRKVSKKTDGMVGLNSKRKIDSLFKNIRSLMVNIGEDPYNRLSEIIFDTNTILKLMSENLNSGILSFQDIEKYYQDMEKINIIAIP